MIWKEVTVEVDEEAVEAVSNIMNELAGSGVQLAVHDGRQRVTAYYNDDQEFPVLLVELEARIAQLAACDLATGEVKISVAETRQQDWANNWQQYFKPLKIGEKFLITPSWEEPDAGGRQIIRIDPGMAFGIGSHETTRMCIELLEEYISSMDSAVIKPLTMLDIGTGTGILSIVAAMLGVKEITAIDIDSAAVEASRENSKINQVDRSVTVIQGDMTRDIQGQFSVITANLLPDLILRLLPSVPALMNEESVLILSGIIPRRKEEIISLLNKLGLEAIIERKLNDWLSLLVKKSR